MSEFANQRLQCLEGNRFLTEDRVCFLDVGMAFSAGRRTVHLTLSKRKPIMSFEVSKCPSPCISFLCEMDSFPPS